MNLDAHLLGIFHEGLLDKQAAFIRQQMDAHLEESILGAAVVGNAFLRCECGELLDVRQVQRFIGLGLDLLGPVLEVAKRLALTGNEQFCRRAFLRCSLLGPASGRHLHGTTTDRLQADGAQHRHREK